MYEIVLSKIVYHRLLQINTPLLACFIEIGPSRNPGTVEGSWAYTATIVYENGRRVKYDARFCR